MMRCTQAETLIPLYVGDDLSAREAAEVREHLDDCAHCRELAAEFTESRAWLREFSAPQFSEAVFEDLRSAVLGEIDASQPSSPWVEFWRGRWRPRWNPRFVVLAASLLLIIGLGIYAWRQQPKHHVEPFAGNGGNKPQQDKEPERPEPRQLVNSSKPKPRTRSTPRPKQADTIASNRQPPNLDVATNNTTASQEMLRIEMQTADPNIRIIWFAPKTDTSNSMNTK